LASTFDQGAGVSCPGVVVMTYSRPSSVNPPMPLDRIRSRLRGDDLSRNQRRHARLQGSRSGELFFQGPPSVAEDDAGDRLEQRAVLFRDLVHRADEDAARAIDRLRLDARRHQAQDLLLERLAVSGTVLVPDHQIHGQALQSPVGVGLDEPVRQLDVGAVADAQQHDGQVSGDGKAPEAGLPAAVLQEHAGVGAQRAVRVDDGAGEPPVELRVRVGGVDLA
jgi:hypothetical protein